jgi:hypothetical protein
MEAFSQNYSPSPKVAEAFSRSDPNPSGFNYQTSTNLLFAKDKLPDEIVLPSAVIALV